METLQAINRRKSVRSYTGALSEEGLQTVIKAGEEAPVGMAKYENVRMTVIRDKELLTEIDAAAGKFFGDPSRHPLYGAPCLIVMSTMVPNPAMGNVPYSNDAMIVQNMTLAAVDAGLGCCAIWGAIAALNQNPDIVAKLGLPEGFAPTCALALGETTEKYVDRDIDLNRIAINYL